MEKDSSSRRAETGPDGIAVESFDLTGERSKMKKSAICLLAAALICVLCSCGKKPEQPAAEGLTAAEASAEASTEASAGTAEDQTADAPSAAALTETSAEAAATEASSEKPEEAAEETDAAPVLPEYRVTNPYTEDKAYDPADYRDLARVGDLSEEEIGHVCEGISDIMAFNVYESGMKVDSFYAPSVTQMIVTGEDGNSTIVYSNIFEGNEYLDSIMKAVGYENYEVCYSYKFGIWALEEEEPAPSFAEILIGSDVYDYYFADGQLVMREGPDGVTNNPETNDFMNSIYKLGCYYGKYAAGERGRYELFVYAPDYVTDKNDKVIIRADINGTDDRFEFIVDKDTVFSEDCELEFFEDHRDGETPLEWYQRMIKEDEEGTAVVGVFDVRTTDMHIDTILGCYWWD